MVDRFATRDKDPKPPTLLGGLGVATVLCTAIAGWIAIGGAFLSETSLFGGFLMLWHWAKVEHLALTRLPHSIIGGLVGIGIAWAMFYGATSFGAVGATLGLVLLMASIYLDIVQLFPLFLNSATMLFSIVAAAPLVQFHINWIELSLAAVVGGLFFAGCVMAVQLLASKLSRTAV